MNPQLVYHAIMSFGLVALVHADVDFYGYREVRTSSRSDSTHFVLQRLGSTELVTSEIRIVPRGAYLDIVEDAWINGNVNQTQIPNLTEEYVFKGSIPVPEKAVITGVQTWTYGTMYRAGLKPRKYSYDKTYPDSAQLQKALDSRVILLQKVADRHYELTLSRIELGVRKHIRIRYLLPNDGGARAQYTIPILFHSRYGSKPRYTKLTLMAADTNGYEVDAVSGPLALEDTSTTMVPYRQTITVRSTNRIKSSIQRTVFEAGDWKGTYQLLNTTLTDTMVQMLSRKIEAVFIWRWNGPEDLVTYRNGVKGISKYGQRVIEQAKQVRVLAEKLGIRGHRTGLVHSIEESGIKKVGLERVSDSTAGEVKEYLDSFNEHDLYRRYSSQPTPDEPVWVPIESSGSTVYSRARDEFVQSVKAATALFSEKGKMLRHIVFVSVGDVSNTFDVLTEDRVDSLLGEVTCDVVRAKWRGVNLPVVCPSVGEQRLAMWHGHYFPGFEPTTVGLTVSNADQAYTFPLTVNASRTYSIIAKTRTEWKSRLTWTGYDHEGTITDSIVTKPHIFEYPADSGLAKIWASDGSHLAEQEEILIGQKYGIVTKATYLQATIDNTAVDGSPGVPYLSDEEIEYPITVERASKRVGKNTFSFTYSNGILHLKAPRNEMLAVLEIRDLRGRLLVRIDLTPFRKGATYTLPLARMLSGLPAQMVVMRIRGMKKTYTAKLSVGGVR